MIKTAQLGKRYNREWVFRNLSYEFKSGHIYAVIGPNGSGKSTLLQVLWGQLPQSEGVLHYHNSLKEIQVEDVFRHCSISAPYMDLIDEFTLEEMIRFHLRLKEPLKGMSDDAVLSKLKLEHAASKSLTNFSSGMRQRVKVGLALSVQAEAYFLDEPCTNFDHESVQWFHTLLNDLPPSSLVIIASNNPVEYPASAIRLSITDFKR